MTMTLSSNNRSSLVISYIRLRQAIGYIGILLPVVLVVGNVLLEGPGIQPSISDYYYTIMRNVFVGTLCAIGIFLLAYRGYEGADAVAGDLACVFAIGVALFPTTPEAGPTRVQQIVGYVHYGFAAAFFLTLSYFCLVLFRKTDPTKAMTREKQQRNIVYSVCGHTMLTCLALILTYGLFLGETVVRKVDPVFWLETLAILAFGLSWLTKGEALLKDEE